jgi:hypothetical protein
MANQILAGAVFQAGQVIAGVDADNPPYVGPPPPTLIVGAKFNDQTGSLYSYNLMDLSSEPTKITASDGEPWEQFGVSLDISGNVAVVGAYDDDDGGTYAGSVYVYNLLDLSEAPTKLVPSELDDYDDFGLYAATNGNLIAVGARMDDDAAGNAGAVYVYDASNLSAQPTKLIPPSSVDSQYFGSDGLSMDDSSLVVGALGSSTVYVYDVNDLSAQPTALTAFDAAANDGFGKAVAMTSTKIFVGSLNDDDNGQDTGSVYIFDRSDLSAQATKLTAYDSTSQQRFGGTLAVSDNYLYVGAQGYLSNQGRVYAYTLSNLSAQPSQLVAYDGQSGDVYSIGLYASNGFLAVGAYLDDDPNQSGAVYVYDESDLSAQPTKLKPSDIDTSAHFGYAFAIGAATPPPDSSSSGSTSSTSPVVEGTWTVVTSAQFGNNFNGQAFIMREGGNNTTLSTPNTGNMVGSSVAISDDYVFVGNSHYDAYGDNAGAVFVFDKATGSMIRTLTGPGITANTGFGSVDMTVVSGGVNRVAVKSNKRAQIVGSPNESFGYGHIQIMDFDGGNVVELSHPDFDINQGYDNMMGFGLSTGWTPTKFVAAMNGSDANGSESGSVFIFNHDGTLATRLDGQNAGDKFGRDISTQSNHERVLVGVSGWNNKAGKAQLFESDGTEVFSIERPTTEAGAHGSAQPEFGKIVAYGSGRIVVGENLDTSVGRVHIFDEIDGSYINTVSLPRNDNPATSDLEVVGNYIFVSASGVNSNNGAFWVYDLDGNNGTRIDNIGSSGFARFGHYLAASVG